MEGNIIQQLIEFALENVWVIIIVIGFIFNFFKRLTGNVSEPTTPIPLPDTFKQFEKEQEERETRPYQVFEAPKVEEEPSVQPIEEVKNDYYERYLELQEKGKLRDKAIQSETKRKVRVQPNNNINRNKVVEGVIWSEILGPPRSKKPYYIRNK